MSSAPDITDSQIEGMLEQASVALYLQNRNLMCEGYPFQLREYPYLIDIYDDESPDVATRKGGQMGMTIMCVLRTIVRCKSYYTRGVLYLMPTKDDVSDFSKGRFDRILRENPQLAIQVEGTDATNIKRIGNAMLYFRGTRSRSQLKSIPVDCIVYDEYDEMDMDKVALADKRLDGSHFKHKFKISTPTLPEFGIDWDYLQSDQKVWKIQCRSCNHWTCMELAFPDCLLRMKDGSVIRCCVKCKRKIEPIHGDWVPAHPGRSISGYWVSQLNSARVDPKTILDDFENPRTVVSEFYNHRLALAYADLDDLLDERSLNACCRDEARKVASEDDSIMGADVGKSTIHYAVGKKRSETAVDVSEYGKLVDGDRGSAFQQLADKMERHHVTLCVMDEMAETRSVREFKEKHNSVYGCFYSPGQRKEYDWNDYTSTVTVNRTESLDASHRMVIRTDISFPRADEGFGEFKRQMKNLARQKVTDEKTGQQKTIWVVRGIKNDHYRHAINYLCIAADKAGICKASQKARGRRREPPRRGSWMSR